MAIVCENYLESQISKENFTDIQQAISHLVVELPEEGSPPDWLIPIGLKGWLLWSAMTNRPRTGWLPGYLPSWPGRSPGSC